MEHIINSTLDNPQHSMAACLPTDSALLHPQFLFGAATAAFQIEGANATDGRLTTIWDTFCATPGKVLNGDDGAIACDHYRLWSEDLDLVKNLGFGGYRLSIAWARVMDERGLPNERGIAFYKRLLDRLQALNIKAFVTLYHWDLPQYLQDRGGWMNRETAYRFAEYADLMSRELQGRVAAWATLNEPWVIADLGHVAGVHAPGLTDPRMATQAMHHLLLAHGLALPILRANDPGAQVGLVANIGFGEPHRDTPADRHAAALCDAHHNGWVLDPLFKGEYPAALFEMWPGAQPLVLAGDMEIISRPMDYLGINYYMRNVLESDGAHGYRHVQVPDVERTQMGWEVYPDGLRQLLLTLHRRYPNLPPIYITENGLASDDIVQTDQVEDSQRLSYLQRHLGAVDQAIRQGVDVRGYFAWSLLDNFEWSYGYERRFGIVHVDYSTQKRTPKLSALAFQRFLKQRTEL